MNAGCRHPRGLSLVFSSGFSFSYLLILLPVRRVDRGPAPRYNERRTFWFRFILAAQLPATASDGLYSSTFLSSLCDYFACCSLPLRYADFYRTFAAQRFVRHLCISKAGTFLSIHFSFFLEKRRFWLREEFVSLFQTFSRNDLPGEAALARGRYVFQKKKRKKRGKTSILI